MAEIAALGFIVLFAVQAVGTVIYLFLIGRLFNRLEARHGTLYATLGSPSLFLNNTFRNNISVLGWLWRREFESLEDPETMRRATIVRFLLVALAVNFGVLLILFFVFGSIQSRAV